MRGRCFSVLVLLALPVFLCACGKPPQSVILSAFSADLSFSSDGADYEGVFTLKNGKTMQLMLRTPSELQGLCFVYENDQLLVRFGEAALSPADAEALGLPPMPLHALFQALSAFCDVPQVLSENGFAEVSTCRGTAVVSFLPQSQLLQHVKLGELTFAFKNLSP